VVRPRSSTAESFEEGRLPAPPRPGTRSRFGREDVEFSRAIGFVDATFAIAATLLVTTLIPGPKAWSSWSDLYDAVAGPFLAFAISFVVIAAYWFGNHQFVASLDALTPRVVVATLWLLAFVVLLPFTTDGLGRDLGSAEVTTVVYAVNVALVSTAEWVIYRVAVQQGLFRNPPSRIEANASTLCQLLPSAVFLVSIAIALLWSPSAARWSWLSLLVLSPIAGRWANRRIAAADGTPLAS
jgi:uncharacterized membrane protein